MRESATVSSDHFQFLISEQQQQRCLARLSIPMAIRWPKDHEQFTYSIKTITESLPVAFVDFFKLSLFSSALLSDAEASLKHLVGWLNESGAQNILKPITLDQAVEGTWRTVRVVRVQEGTASLVHFLVGALPAQSPSAQMVNMPDWAANLLTNSSRVAVADAFSAIQSLSRQSTFLFCFPLTPPDGRALHDGPGARFGIDGRSLGLPIGIGARSAIIGSRLPDKWLATGDLQGSGDVHKVRSIQTKYDCALQNKFSLFVCPLEESSLIGHDTSRIEVKRVSNLDQACLWAHRYFSPEDREEVSRLETAIQTPKDFTANCLGLSTSSLVYCLENGMGKNLVEAVQMQPEIALRFVNCIERSLKEKGNHHAEVLAKFIDQNGLEVLGETDAVAALSYCSSCLTLANHSGRKGDEDLWYDKGSIFADSARKRKEGREVYVRFVNRRFGVSERHNNYFFQEDLPDEFIDILDSQQQINILQGNCIDYALGSLYGTLAQNFAFCGPEFIGLTLCTLDRAMSAFGDGIDREYKRDWSRQLSYLFFALIDAKKFHDSEKILLKYIEIEKYGKFQINNYLNDGYKMHAISRFLSECHSPISIIFIDAISQILNLKKDSTPSTFKSASLIHPWQLFYFNLAKIAKKLEKKEIEKRSLALSLDLCNQCGETIQAMGLLPLSLASFMNDRCMHFEKIINMIRTNKKFNKEHFAEILNKNMENALDILNQSPEHYFPFAYR